MSSKTGKAESYLTETILSIHNEIQSALDYISSVASKEVTELGQSSAIVNIERLRIKIPLKISLELGKKKLPAPPTEPLSIVDIRKNLAKRTGFVLERDLPKKFSTYSKVKVNLRPAETAATRAPAAGEAKEPTEEFGWGEIEITFVPLKRD